MDLNGFKHAIQQSHISLDLNLETILFQIDNPKEDTFKNMNWHFVEAVDKVRITKIV